ncbi:condensation domain-containing protein [Longispora urticae]
MTGIQPLSAGQEGLWLLYGLAPDGVAYNDAGAAQMSPAPDLAILQRAVRALAERHDLLCSRFIEVDGEPRREIGDPDSLRFEVRDVGDIDDEALLDLVRATIKVPYRLEETGPFRFVMWRRAEDAVLMIGSHHIATDAQSNWLLWRDLLEAYWAFSAGREPDWTPLTVSYADHVAHERTLLDSPRREILEGYWRTAVADATAAELPTDRPRPAKRSFVGDAYTRRVPDELVPRIKAAATAAGVTPFAYLLGVFQSLVFRYSGQTDFVIGCPASTRRRGGMREVIGYFVNPLLLRSRFSSTTTFAEAIAAAGVTVSGGMAHASYPTSLLGGQRFNMCFTQVSAGKMTGYLDRIAAGETVEHEGYRLRSLDVPHLEGQFDLTVEITQSTDSLIAAFRYDTDLFDRATIERFVGHFLRLTEVAVSTPDVRVSRASLVDDAERQRLLAMATGSA